MLIKPAHLTPSYLWSWTSRSMTSMEINADWKNNEHANYDFIDKIRIYKDLQEWFRTQQFRNPKNNTNPNLSTQLNSLFNSTLFVSTSNLASISAISMRGTVTKWARKERKLIESLRTKVLRIFLFFPFFPKSKYIGSWTTFLYCLK